MVEKLVRREGSLWTNSVRLYERKNGLRRWKNTKLLKKISEVCRVNYAYLKEIVLHLAEGVKDVYNIQVD